MQATMEGDSECSSVFEESTEEMEQPSSNSSDSNRVIGKRETRQVNRTKVQLYIVILMATVASAFVTFRYARNEELDDFALQFHDFAIELAEAAHHEAANAFNGIKSLSATVTNQAKLTKSKFPFLTLENFEYIGFLNNELSLALQVSYAPLVSLDQMDEWNEYSQKEQSWIDHSLWYSIEHLGRPNFVKESNGTFFRQPIFPSVYELQDYERTRVSTNRTLYAPVWQQSPAPKDPSIINFDLLSHPSFARVYRGMLNTNEPVLSEVLRLDFLYGGAVQDEFEHPHSFLLDPVYGRFDDQDPEGIVGLLVAVIPWDTYFSNLLPDEITGIVIVLHNSCGGYHSYRIDGRNATFLGTGDLHDPAYSKHQFATTFATFAQDVVDENSCVYDLIIYPSAEMELRYLTREPLIYALLIACVFLMTGSVFMAYDRAVSIRQRMVLNTAQKANAVVSSLFPKNVRDRIMEDAKRQAEEEEKNGRSQVASDKSKLKDFLGETEFDLEENPTSLTSLLDSKPIADLFPSATVMFADISGFTSWCSVREPNQVFILLESLYQAFDTIAKRRRVFKVETIGDCYVAVAGLPDPRRDHAIVMARFARDCLHRSVSLMQDLETVLGPDTSELGVRFGLHSGEITAGVLRGQNCRFQLFGDTVNTAARIESTGEQNRIHVSNETAALIMQSGKQNWLVPRSESVQAKGKGELSTYWLRVDARSSRGSNHSTTGTSSEHLEAISRHVTTKESRLVSWAVEVLARILQKVVARRLQNGHPMTRNHANDYFYTTAPTGSVIEEVVETIALPSFQPGEAKEQPVVELEPDVVVELKKFVQQIASFYRDNPFHNFEHASHVTMSTTKLLSRIIAPTDIIDEANGQNLKQSLFACVFASLIHDVDHAGVPNEQLVKEKTRVALQYRNQSVAEQNSVDLAWKLLMSPEFPNFRRALFQTPQDYTRFRQLVVNSVMATDLADKQLKELRNARWSRAFSESAGNEGDASNRKATIVIEHLIQASDVSHTMQHWHVYRKWNERLFREMMAAYVNGRAMANPAEFWYRGEIGFFDYYIIPLAKKLKDCGVFGVSSDEYLTWAEKNRSEWAIKGEAIVAEMLTSFQQEQLDTSQPS